MTSIDLGGDRLGLARYDLGIYLNRSTPQFRLFGCVARLFTRAFGYRWLILSLSIVTKIGTQLSTLGLFCGALNYYSIITIKGGLVTLHLSFNGGYVVTTSGLNRTSFLIGLRGNFLTTLSKITSTLAKSFVVKDGFQRKGILIMVRIGSIPLFFNRGVTMGVRRYYGFRILDRGVAHFPFIWARGMSFDMGFVGFAITVVTRLLSFIGDWVTDFGGFSWVIRFYERGRDSHRISSKDLL